MSKHNKSHRSVHPAHRRRNADGIPDDVLLPLAPVQPSFLAPQATQPVLPYPYPLSRPRPSRPRRAVAVVKAKASELAKSIKPEAATITKEHLFGVGANAAVFSFLDRVFVREPAGIEDAGGVRRLYHHFATDRSPTGVMTVAPFNYPSYESIRDGFGARARVVAYTEPDSLGISVGAQDVSGRAAWVGAIVLAGNVLRNAVLVALESRPTGSSAAWHEAVGLVVLAVVCGAVLALMQRRETPDA